MSARRFEALLHGLSTQSAFINYIARERQKTHPPKKTNIPKGKNAMKKTPQQITLELLQGAYKR